MTAAKLIVGFIGLATMLMCIVLLILGLSCLDASGYERIIFASIAIPWVVISSVSTIIFLSDVK